MIVAIEGIDGAGKTTIVGRICERLGLPTWHAIHFPDYNGPLGGAIRNTLCDAEFDPYAQCRSLSRIEHRLG